MCANLKPGDFVVCINNESNTYLERGKIYQIKGVSPSMVSLVEKFGNFYKDRFKKVGKCVTL